jgi:hypothetical protein
MIITITGIFTHGASMIKIKLSEIRVLFYVTYFVLLMGFNHYLGHYALPALVIGYSRRRARREKKSEHSYRNMSDHHPFLTPRFTAGLERTEKPVRQRLVKI